MMELKLFNNIAFIFCALKLLNSSLAYANSVDLCPEPQCSCLGSHVDCSKRGLTFVPENLPSWTEYLELQGNQITNLTSFPSLPHVKKLDLSGCGLTNLPSSIFGSILSLESLSLRHNNLQKILADFRRLRNLTRLDLRGNDISSLDRKILQTVRHVQELDLGKNGLRIWPDNPFGAPASLRSLFLDGNRIFSVTSGSFANLTGLRLLKLAKNRIQYLPKDVFRSLGNLTLLDLSRNRIKRLDGLSFRGLVQLRTLRLSRNGLRRLEDAAFWGLENLKELQLKDNRISTVGKGWLYGITFLQKMYLSNNEISLIDSAGWNYCKDLKVLDLSKNRLENLARRSFWFLKKLQELYLNNNNLDSVTNDSFAGLQHLQLLDLSSNQLSSVVEDTLRPFSALTSVRELRLANNELKMIPSKAFKGLGNLVVLDLSRNPVTTLSRNSFWGMDSLTEICLNTTSLLCDCNLDWMKGWLEEKMLQIAPNQLICDHPDNLSGYSLLELPQENLTCEDTPKPVITLQPSDTVALQGGNTSLECAAKANGEARISVQWKRDNQVLYEEENSLEIENSIERLPDGFVKFKSALKIWLLRQEDTAEYQCVMANKFGTGYSQKADLTVHVFPSFLKRPEDMVVPVGGTARLECAALGFPAPILAWRKDGGDDFPAARDRRMHVMPTDDVFFIVNAQLQDSGVYTCRATNNAGEATVDARLTVLAKPGFQNTMKNAVVRVGATHPFQCMVSGSPRPEIKWFFNGAEIVSDESRKIPADNPQILVLINVALGDTGVYECKVTNQLGSSRQSARLTVTRDFDKAKIDLKTAVIDSTIGLESKESKPEVVFSFDPASTPGIVIIAVVSCIVVTSLIWVLVIWICRARRPKNSGAKRSELSIIPAQTAHFSPPPDISKPVQISRSNFGENNLHNGHQWDSAADCFRETPAVLAHLNDARAFAPSGSTGRRRRKVFKVVHAPDAPSAGENNLETLLPGETIEMTSSEGSDDVTMANSTFYRPQTSSLDSGVGPDGPLLAPDRQNTATDDAEGREMLFAGTLPKCLVDRTAANANRSPSPQKRQFGMVQNGGLRTFGRSGSPAFWGER